MQMAHHCLSAFQWETVRFSGNNRLLTLDIQNRIIGKIIIVDTPNAVLYWNTPFLLNVTWLHSARYLACNKFVQFTFFIGLHSLVQYLSWWRIPSSLLCYLSSCNAGLLAPRRLLLDVILAIMEIWILQAQCRCPCCPVSTWSRLK